MKPLLKYIAKKGKRLGKGASKLDKEYGISEKLGDASAFAGKVGKKVGEKAKFAGEMALGASSLGAKKGADFVKKNPVKSTAAASILAGLAAGKFGEDDEDEDEKKKKKKKKRPYLEE